MLNDERYKEKIMKLAEDLRNAIDGVKELDRDLASDDNDNNLFIEYGLSTLTILSQELSSAMDEIWERGMNNVKHREI